MKKDTGIMNERPAIYQPSARLWGWSWQTAKGMIIHSFPSLSKRR
jgi:hypothetical protein